MHQDRKNMDRNRFAQGEWRNRSEEEPLVQLPSLFLQHLTPEQYRAHQQTYQIAYERAVQQTQRDPMRDPNVGNDWLGTGEGI